MVHSWFAKLHALKPSRIVEWNLMNLSLLRGFKFKKQQDHFLILLNGCAIVWVQRECDMQREYEKTNHFKGTAFRAVMALTTIGVGADYEMELVISSPKPPVG